MRPTPPQDDHGNSTHPPDATAIAFPELAYRQFTDWLDSELEQLVARWQHLAAPRATERCRSHGKSGRR
jgi:hypothetical protein